MRRLTGRVSCQRNGCLGSSDQLSCANQTIDSIKVGNAQFLLKVGGGVLMNKYIAGEKKSGNSSFFKLNLKEARE